jgi:fatty acid desaturase
MATNLAQPEIDRTTRTLTRRDTRVFTMKLAIVTLVAAALVAWIVNHGWLPSLPAQVLLAVLFAHAVELQHQALHGTGLRSARLNRVVGMALGLPMLVSHSRYRALHLLHHRYLGTDKDTEFFEYATQDGLTFRALLLSAFNVRRWAGAVRDMLLSLRPTHRFDEAIANERVHRRIRTEYRLMLAAVVGMTVLSVVVGSPLVVSLWLLPLCLAEPVHFAIELPEHLFCDRTTQDPFRNSRSIRGSWFSFWLTNGNNLHAEHHYRMGVPINKLPLVHAAVVDRIEHYTPTYWSFYREVFLRARMAERS